MKLHTTTDKVERGGTTTESTFSIKTNALSFSILSSGLYTDTKRAVVRELSCNAFDAHVDAGTKDTPFIIHLPNKLEPFFSIKDFGTGLSDQDIQGDRIETEDDEGNTIIRYTGGLYTTYFDSTKTQSNDFIGALGLGSKSPFSYTSAFEVISRFDGMRRTYAIFLNEDGIPSVALMNEIETDEPAGLEVKIAIEDYDHYKFKTLTSEILKYFPVKPIIKGVPDFEFADIAKGTINGKNWMLTANDKYGNSSIVAVQGNVAYRVDRNAIEEYLDDQSKQLVYASKMILFFDIGDLEVSANREEIRYDDRSVEALKNKIKLVSKEFTSEVEKMVQANYNNYWDACIGITKVAKSVFGTRSIIPLLDKDVIKDQYLKAYIANNGNVVFDSPDGYQIKYYELKSGNTHMKKWSIFDTVTPSSSSIIVINDIRVGGITRMKNYLYDSTTHKSVVLIKKQDPMPRVDSDKNPIPYVGHDTELKTLMEGLGNPEIHILSEITQAVKRDKTSAQERRPLPVYKYSGTHYPNNSDYTNKVTWRYTDHDMNAGGLFIPLRYASRPYYERDEDRTLFFDYWDGDDFTDDLIFILNDYNAANGTGFGINDVFGLPAVAYKQAQKSDKWINLYEFTEKNILKYIPYMEFHNDLNAADDIFSIKNVLHDESFIKYVKRLPTTSPFRMAVLPVIRQSAKIQNRNLGTAEKLFNQYYRHNPKVSVRIGVPLFQPKEFKHYKMLNLTEDFSANTNWKILFEYIKLIDQRI